MIATGEYARLAAVTAPAFVWATGLEIEVIRETSDLGIGSEGPFAHKLLLPDDEQYIFVDADIIFLRKWSVPEVTAETFAGVPAQRYEANLRAVIDRYGGDPKKFLNTGLFIASKAHKRVMVQAMEWMLDGVSILHEESVLNCALQRYRTPLMRLPLTCNLQICSTVRATAVHACAQRGVDAKFRHINWLLKNFAPASLKDALRASRSAS